MSHYKPADPRAARSATGDRTNLAAIRHVLCYGRGMSAPPPPSPQDSTEVQAAASSRSGPGADRFIVGLTGGIGSGKTTIADALGELGATLVDTDRIAHELTGPGGDAMAALIAEFGPDVADSDGRLDRAAMRARVFTTPADRHRLEGILHPLIGAESQRQIQAATGPYVVLVVPLLIEGGRWRERSDRVLVVDCPEAVQIERVMQRNGLAREQVQAIMAAQATRAQRLAAADDVFDNGGPLGDVRARVAALHERYLQAAAARSGPRA